MRRISSITIFSITTLAISLSTGLAQSSPNGCTLQPDECFTTGKKDPNNSPGTTPNDGEGPTPDFITPPKIETAKAPEDDEDATPQNNCAIKQAMENQIDKLAREVADEIRSQSKWDEIEYGAIIYRDGGGKFSREALDSGTADNVDWSVSPSEGTIVALVHSHTPGSYSIPSPGDWAALEKLIANKKVNVDEANFAHYILNYDNNTFYEYENSNRPRADGLGFGNSDHAADAASEGQCDE